MRFPLFTWGLQNSISFSQDQTDVPAIAVNSSEFLYFASIAKGTCGSLNTGASYSIVIGKISQSGTLQWMRLFPELITSQDEGQPNLLIGPSNELYVAYTTLGSTANNFNMTTVPTFCNPCPVPDDRDIVIARIDELTANTPTVTWTIQSAIVNSCARESVPQLAIDKKNQLLYVCLQTSLAIQCFVPTGSTNIYVACINFQGSMLWSEGGNKINSTGANTNPVIAADEKGGLFIALETTSTITGGAPTTNKQVEVIKYQTTVPSPGTISSYVRQWVLSGITTALRPATGTSEQPSVAADPAGNLYMSFITNGLLTGGTKVNGNYDVVLASISGTGQIIWMKQGPILNGPTWQYSNCDAPYLTRDAPGNIFLTLRTTVSGPSQNILTFKVNPTNGEMLWQYGPNLNGYLFARSGAPNAIFSSVNNAYSKTALARYGNNIYLAVNTTQNLPTISHTSTGNDLCIVAFTERTYAVGYTPYTFIESRTICNCGGGCSCARPL